MKLFLTAGEVSTARRSPAIPILFEVDVDLQGLVAQLALIPDFGEKVIATVARQLKANMELRDYFRDAADFDRAWDTAWDAAERDAKLGVPALREAFGLSQPQHDGVGEESEGYGK